MNHKVGIWIDHKKAVIVSASADRVAAEILESNVGSHARYSGPQDGGGEKQYEERYSQHLDRYYDKVISHLGQPEALLIFGPVRRSCSSRSVSVAPTRSLGALSESRPRTSSPIRRSWRRSKNTTASIADDRKRCS